MYQTLHAYICLYLYTAKCPIHDTWVQFSYEPQRQVSDSHASLACSQWNSLTTRYSETKRKRAGRIQLYASHSCWTHIWVGIGENNPSDYTITRGLATGPLFSRVFETVIVGFSAFKSKIEVNSQRDLSLLPFNAKHFCVGDAKLIFERFSCTQLCILPVWSWV